MDVKDLVSWKTLLVPVGAFLLWAANEYVTDLIAQETAPVKASVVQMVELQRQQVNDAKFKSCMEFKYQDIDFQQRMIKCNDEKSQRREYWAWEDCVKRVTDEGRNKQIDPLGVCGREPVWID